MFYKGEWFIEEGGCELSLTLDYFMDENLKLYQDKEHFRFNTDTKLLAKFVHLKKQERILDIGTNNAALLVYFV